MERKNRSRYKRMPLGKRIALRPRDIEVLDFAQRHERVTSPEIYRFIGTESTKYRQRLRNIFHELGYLERPTHKRELAALAGKPLIYALSEAGAKVLSARRHVHAKPHSGWHEHLYILTRLTAWFELACRKHGFRFIHREELFARPEATNKQLRMMVSGHPHIPDDLFGIEYTDGKKRYFALEADRATEDLKTIYRKIDAYDAMLQSRAFKDWGLFNLTVLIVTLSPGRVLTLLEYVKNNTRYPKAFLFKAHPEFEEPYHKVTDFYSVMEKLWLTAEGEFFIDRA